jgi:putative tricarboxylic transport membrane protein
MDVINNLVLGFSVSLKLVNIWYCFIGVLIGTLIGVLPGIGPTVTIAMLLPITFKLDTTTAIIMLAGIYYGAQYGGSTTSILVKMPGEASSVITCIDGYQMAKQGRAGAALGIAAFGSFIAGSVATFGLALVAPPLAKMALSMGPPEYFNLLCFGLILATFLSQGTMLKSIMMVVLGLIISTIGRDAISNYPRFTYGVYELAEGVGFIPMIMGLFGISEIMSNVESSSNTKSDVYQQRISGLLPSFKDWALSIGPIIRGSVVGFLLGVLPGGGAMLGSFFSYSIEKKLAKDPSLFGKGAIQGVAGPESANNAGSQGAFIPLLTLGIPSNSVMALLVGALMIHGVQPGPLIITKTPDLFWGTITSMYIGNVMLLILNLPLIKLWVKMLSIPYKILFPVILLFCVIGAYSINNNVFEIYLMIAFGIIGYIMRKYEFDAAPLVLAYILGSMLEENLRQALIISQGSFAIFIGSPLSTFFLIASVLCILLQSVPAIYRSKSRALES